MSKSVLQEIMGLAEGMARLTKRVQTLETASEVGLVFEPAATALSSSKARAKALIITNCRHCPYGVDIHHYRRMCTRTTHDVDPNSIPINCPLEDYPRPSSGDQQPTPTCKE